MRPEPSHQPSVDSLFPFIPFRGFTYLSFLLFSLQSPVSSPCSIPYLFLLIVYIIYLYTTTTRHNTLQENEPALSSLKVNQCPTPSSFLCSDSFLPVSPTSSRLGCRNYIPALQRVPSVPWQPLPSTRADAPLSKNPLSRHPVTFTLRARQHLNDYQTKSSSSASSFTSSVRRSHFSFCFPCIAFAFLTTDGIVGSFKLSMPTASLRWCCSTRNGEASLSRPTYTPTTYPTVHPTP